MVAPITEEDFVEVKGRYLVKKKKNGEGGRGDDDAGGGGGGAAHRSSVSEEDATTYTRFYIRGMAFPIQIPFSPENRGYNPAGWKAVLEQIAEASPNVNVVRLYDVDCRVDYTEFLDAAARLGVYVIVPFTSFSGPGVLGRDYDAPLCYPHKLYEYGKTCVNNFARYPNVLAGVLGNEVMNSLLTWKAAPCILAYARDLKRYMESTLLTGGQGGGGSSSGGRRTSMIPLLYSAQHDSIGGAVIPPGPAMKLTLDYLTCDDESSIDVFGINVESWCSSLQTFQYNEDGSVGSYYSLWRELHNSTIPLAFTEMGCSKQFFNKDNGLRRYVRDWAQVPVVLGEMNDTFSGFVAYAYDGNPMFTMTRDGPWRGQGTLQFSEDFENFKNQLAKIDYDHLASSVNLQDEAFPSTVGSSKVTCEQVANTLKDATDVVLYAIENMPTYFELEEGEAATTDFPTLDPLATDVVPFSLDTGSSSNAGFVVIALGVVFCIAFVGVMIFCGKVSRRRKKQAVAKGDEHAVVKNYQKTYMSISSEEGD